MTVPHEAHATDPRATHARAPHDAAADADRPVARPAAASDDDVALLASVGGTVLAIRDVLLRPGARAPQAGGGASAGDAPPELVRLLAQLRAAVAVLTWRWRDAGEPIERVLVRVKALTRAADAAGDWRDARDALTPRVVRWTIESYYERPPRRDAPPGH